jgi:hypothetical protein
MNKKKRETSSGVIPEPWPTRALQSVAVQTRINGLRHRLVSRLRGADSVTSYPHAADAGFAGVGLPTLLEKAIPMEAAGIEPASAIAPVRASTSLGCRLVSPAGRLATDLPAD